MKYGISILRIAIRKSARCPPTSDFRPPTSDLLPVTWKSLSCFSRFSRLNLHAPCSMLPAGRSAERIAPWDLLHFRALSVMVSTHLGPTGNSQIKLKFRNRHDLEIKKLRYWGIHLSEPLELPFPNSRIPQFLNSRIPQLPRGRFSHVGNKWPLGGCQR